MKKNGFAILKAEIKHESQNLERLLGEMERVLAIPKPSSLEVRAAGSILHDFYSGIEKIFILPLTGTYM